MGLAQHMGRGVALDSLHAVLVIGTLQGLFQFADRETRTATAGKESVPPPGAILEMMEHEYQIRNALQRGDWFSLKTLPQSIWDRIASETHLTCDEWELFPETMYSVVSTNVYCPECNASGRFDDVVKFRDFARGRNFACTFICKNCGQLVGFDYEEQCLVPITSRSAAYYLGIGLGVLLLVYFLLFFFAHDLLDYTGH